MMMLLPGCWWVVDLLIVMIHMLLLLVAVCMCRGLFVCWQAHAPAPSLWTDPPPAASSLLAACLPACVPPICLPVRSQEAVVVPSSE